MSEPGRDQRSADRLQAWLEKGRVDDPLDAADRELRSVVLDARSLAHADDDARVLAARRVSTRVLRETVGVPLLERLRRGLRTSVALRVVAASVLVHLLALPAVAWYVIAPESMPSFVLSFLPAVGDEDQSRSLELAEEEDEESAAERRGAIENRLRVDRFRLSSDDLPEPSGGDVERPRTLSDWVALRIELRRGSVGLPAVALTVDLDDPLTSIAVLDACLDAVALDVDPELARRAAQRARERVAALAAIEGPQRTLAPTALERCDGYGLGSSSAAAPPALDQPEGTDLGLWLRRARGGAGDVRGSGRLSGEPWAAWFGWADAQP